MNHEDHEYYMKEALLEAQKALDTGDVPIGAVVVKDSLIIGRGYNKREAENDPTAHAEIIALRQAGSTIGSWRLKGAVLYVTVEPCPMCAGALVMSRIDRVVYGADDPKAGTAGSLLNLLQFPGFNHNVKITAGVLADECSRLMQEFFSSKRKHSRNDQI